MSDKRLSPQTLRLLLHKNTQRKVSLYVLAPRLVQNPLWLNSIGFWIGKLVASWRAFKSHMKHYPAPTELKTAELLFTHAARQARTMMLKPFAVGWWQAHYLLGVVELETLGYDEKMIERRWAQALIDDLKSRMTPERRAEIDG